MGEKNFKNKLSEQDVMFIFSTVNYTQKELANKFGVTQGTISHIRKGKTWGWLTYNSDINNYIK